MRLLMIDSATIVATAAVLDEERLLGETIVNYKKKHSEKMLPAIDHLLKDSGLDIKNIDVFGVVNGPGSFTGLRIGMATAKGFAQALDRPMVTVSTLEALAANIAYADGVICPMLDAQRNQVYTAAYVPEAGGLRQVIPEQACAIDTLVAALEKFDKPIYLLGDALPKFGDTICNKLPNVVKVAPYLAMNRASSAAAIGLKKALAGETTDCKLAELNYIRKSSAEERFGK